MREEEIDGTKKNGMTKQTYYLSHEVIRNALNFGNFLILAHSTLMQDRLFVFVHCFLTNL